MDKLRSPQDILAAIQGDGAGRDMLRRASALARLAEVVTPLLPAPLRGRAHVGNVSEGELTLIVASSTLASRARLDAPMILTALNEAGVAISGVRVKVARDFRPPWTPPPPRAPVPLSDGARASLLDAAGEFDADDPLRKAIERLANVGRNLGE